MALGEDADSTGVNKERKDDQNDAKENVTPNHTNNSIDANENSENSENEFHRNPPVATLAHR